MGEQQMVSGAVVLLEKVELLIQQCLKKDAQAEIHKAIETMKDPNIMENNIIKNKIVLERDVIGAITEWLTGQKGLAAQSLETVCGPCLCERHATGLQMAVVAALICC